MLDDFHFKNAGLGEEQLDGYYVTEDDGQPAPRASRQRAAAVPHSVPASRRRRSTTSAASPSGSPGAVVVFGDDGEKFGTWPGTKEHVYDRGWLRAVLRRARRPTPTGCRLTTPSEAIEAVPPLGKLYLPEGSYREMTEWALPADADQPVRRRSSTSWSTTAAGTRSSRSSAAATGGTSR